MPKKNKQACMLNFDGLCLSAKYLLNVQIKTFCNGHYKMLKIKHS